MNRTCVERLRDARSFADKVSRLVFGMDPDLFRREEHYLFAACYCLLAIGEALRHVPAKVQAMAPVIPWRSIINMRHRLAHDYWLANSRLVLETGLRDMRPLIIELDALIAVLDDRDR